jgi:hypothetical protein
MYRREMKNEYADDSMLCIIYEKKRWCVIASIISFYYVFTVLYIDKKLHHHEKFNDASYTKEHFKDNRTP